MTTAQTRAAIKRASKQARSAMRQLDKDTETSLRQLYQQAVEQIQRNINAAETLDCSITLQQKAVLMQQLNQPISETETCSPVHI